MSSYILTKDDEDDLDRIHEFGVYKFGMTQADKNYEMFCECFERIALNPLMFPTSVHLNKGYRYCVCGVETIYFNVKVDEVEKITIVGRQNF